MAKQPTEKVITKKHMARLERERQQQRYLIIGAIVIIVLVVAILVYGILDQTVIKSQRPVAKVGSETITTSEFQKEVRFQRAQTIQQLQTYMGDPFIMQIYGSYITEMAGQLEQPTTIGQSVLDKMVEDAVIEQEAKKRGITVSVAEIDKAFEEAFGFFENGTPTPTITSTPFSTSTLAPLQQTLVPPTAAATETAVPSESPTATGAPSTPTAEVTATPAVAVTPESTATITPTETPYTRQGYETAVGSFAENLKPVGYTDADLRSLIRRQVLREKVLNAVTEDVATSQEVLWARHILVADEAEAKKVEEELKNGGNFVDLAKQYSTDTSNKDQGGDLGWFPREQMVTEFSEAAFLLRWVRLASRSRLSSVTTSSRSLAMRRAQWTPRSCRTPNRQPTRPGSITPKKS